MTRLESAAAFARAMFAPRDDPYEGADVAVARRVTAAVLGLGGLLSIAFLPFEPPSEQIGWPGWPLAAAVIAAQLAGAVLVIRRQASFRDLLGVAYGGVFAVAVLNWLAGAGSSAYEDLLVLWVCVGGIHPARRAAPHFAVLAAVVFAPVAYEGTSWNTVSDAAAEVLLLWGIGAIVVSYLFYVRSQRAALEQGAEVARRLARVDPLTGLGNRRAFDEALTVELARSERERVPLSVGLVDLDSLKRINDNFGHLEGDRCLGEVARTMERSLRAGDLCFRWGGDEFVTLLPRTDRETAWQVLGRLVRDIEQDCRDVDRQPISLSYGVAQMERGGSAEDMLAMADLALMEQKTEKRR